MQKSISFNHKNHINYAFSSQPSLIRVYFRSPPPLPPPLFRGTSAMLTKTVFKLKGEMSGKNIKGLALLPVLNHKRGGVSKTNENEA